MHDTRVAARRARSTLRTFAGLFDPAARVVLDDALRDHARSLGSVRDLQVLRSTLDEHAGGSLATWLADGTARALGGGWQRLERDLDAAGHRRLPDLFAAAVLARSDDDLDLARCADRAAKAARKRLARAGDDVDRLHDARKAAKRARYAAEALGGRDDDVRLFKRLQGLLGDHHDLSEAAAYVDGAGLPTALRADGEALVTRLRTLAERARQDALVWPHEPDAG